MNQRTMRRSTFAIALFLCASRGFAQTNLNVHTSDGGITIHRMSDVDSITYVYDPAPGLMSVHDPNNLATYPLDEVDSLTYGEGGPLGTALIATRPPIVLSGTAASVSGYIAVDFGNYIGQKGVCYATSPDATTADGIVSGGNGLAAFTVELVGLDPVTTYYARTFATNSAGTTYGNQVSFTTQGEPMDIDGNTYPTVQIGDQEWMAANLKTTRYRNGDLIPTGLNDAAWSTTPDGAFSYPFGDQASVPTYGLLYNFSAVSDPRHVCPAGWHEPTNDDWVELMNGLGGPTLAGGALKAEGSLSNTGLWADPNVGATNASGFTALPGGNRDDGGGYGASESFGTFALFWTSTPFGDLNARYAVLYSNTTEVYFDILFSPRNGGFVRCVRD